MVEIRTADHAVSLSSDESWELFVLLGDAAPFVRNGLSVERRGGAGAVWLSTAEERQQVLQVLVPYRRGTLSSGLSLLRAALEESTSRVSQDTRANPQPQMHSQARRQT